MTDELKYKLKKMSESADSEMRHLAHKIFWASEPTWLEVYQMINFIQHMKVHFVKKQDYEMAKKYRDLERLYYKTHDNEHGTNQ